LRLTVRSRIAIDLVAAVTVSLVIVGLGAFIAAKQVMYDTGQELVDQLGRSYVAQVALNRHAGKLLSHPDNVDVLRRLMPHDAFAHMKVNLAVVDRLGGEAWVLPGRLSGTTLVTRRSIRGGGRLVLKTAATSPALGLASLIETLLLLSLGTLVVVGVLAWWLLNRSIAQPVAQLIGAVEEAQSDGTELPVLPDMGSELTALQKAIDRMRYRLDFARQELGDRHSALQTAHSDLLQARQVAHRAEHLAGVGRLAAGIAHEVGNPLTALIGFVQLLRKDQVPAERRAEVLERLEGELDRIRSIIGRLLAYARPGDQQLTPVDVGACTEEAVALVRADNAFRCVDLDTLIEPDLPFALCDSNGLKQVLINLCLNAAEACSSEERASVNVRVGSLIGHVELIVEDSGQGIDPAVAAVLFEPFVTTKDVGEGTGLGLAVCHGLVESWGGELSVVESTLHGAAFSVRIPTCQESV
jgi:two-component system, NtrC family, sensor kinase